jgi:hypothetical protein
MKRMAVPNEELTILKAENRLKAALFFFGMVAVAGVTLASCVGGF